MEVRSLEALFNFKFDDNELKEAIKSVDGFADNVNAMINSFAQKMPIEVVVKFNENKAKETQKKVSN